MAYFAKIDSNNIVTDLIKADQDFVNNLEGTWIETNKYTHGNIHYESLPQGGINFKAPSQDQSQALRKNYASVGYIYDPQADGFYRPQPFSSHTLNPNTFLWEAPVAFPTIVNDGADPVVWEYVIYWDEDAYQADNTKGWKASRRNADLSPLSDTNTYVWNGSSWSIE